MDHITVKRKGERGSAGVKFVAIFAVILLFAHAGWNYIPVAYEAESLRTEMQTAVVQGLALPGKVNPVDNVKTRIQQAAQRNNVPPDALIEVKQAGNSLTAHVVYQKNVNILPFGLFRYSYQFDHTATPTGFLMKN
jgi:hypothetical protein